MRKVFFFIILFFLLTELNAQSIRGVVIDSIKGEALCGAFVYIPELNQGQLTDKNGKFVFDKIPKGKLHLQVSFLGYETKIFEINTSDNQFVRLTLKPTAIQAEEVVVSSALSPSQHNNAVKVDVLQLNPLKITAASFGDILTGIPGLDMVKRGGAVQTPVIRGLSLSNILVLFDGFRLEDFQFSINHPFFIDEIGTKKIEVIKGPASLMYGSDAVGGIINVIPDTYVRASKTNIEYSLVYQTNTQGVNSTFAIKHAYKKISFGAFLGVKSHKDYKDALGNQVLNTRYNQKFFKAFLNFNTNKGITKLFYSFNKSLLGLCVPPALRLVKDDLRQNHVFYQDLSHHFFYIKNLFFLNNWKIYFNASSELNNRAIKIIDTLPAPVNMTLKNFNYELKFNYSSYHSLIYFGFQGNYSHNKNNVQVGKFIPDYSELSFSGFTYGKYKFTQAWNIQGGLRYDFKKFIIPQQDFYNMFNTTAYKNFYDFSASVGSVVKPIEGFFIRLNFANAYRTPNIAELAEHGLHAYRYELGNMKLNSQRSYEGDLSFHLHTSRLMLDASFFYNRILNYIFLSPTSDTAFNGMRIYSYDQKDAIIRGFEIEAMASLFKNFVIKSSYNYALGTLLNDFIPLFPQNKIKTDFIYKYNFNKVHTEFVLKLLYAFSQNHPSKYELPTPSYWLINPSFDIELSSKFIVYNFAVKIDNLLNIKYIDHLSTVRDLGFYDPGRNILLQLKIAFK